MQETKSDTEKKYPNGYKGIHAILATVKSKLSKSTFSYILALYWLCIVLVILYSLFVNFECSQILSINFEDNIKIITTGAITLISINLFVTNLLLTHLKEERDEIQTIIDRKIYFKFITYLGFSIIINILLLYFFSPTVNNHAIKTNILIFIFLSFLIYIFLLVRLYTTVFEFIDKAKREKIIKEELKEESRRSFYHYYDPTSQKEEKWHLFSFFKNKGKELFDKELEYEILDKLIQKVYSNTLENKFIFLGNNLEYLRTVYVEYLEYLKSLESLKHIEHPIYKALSTPEYITKIQHAIFRNIIVASERDHKESFKILLDFSLNKFALEALDKDNKDESNKALYQTLIFLVKKTLESDDHTLLNRVFETLKKNWIFLRVDDSSEKRQYLFQFQTTLLCWIYFLKSEGKISLEQYNLDFIEKSFNDVSSGSNFINDFYNLYDDVDGGLWGVKEWQIKEPQIGIPYWVLKPEAWMPVGLAFILLKYSDNLIPNNFENIQVNDRFKYALNNTIEKLGPITIKDLKDIDPIFWGRFQIEEILKYRKDKIMTLFRYLKEKIEISDYERIKAIPLSEEKIARYREKVGTLWKTKQSVINVLKHKKCVHYKADNSEEEKGSGYLIPIQNYKAAFIDGNHYSNIRHLENFIETPAENIDKLFFEEVLKIKPPIQCDDIYICIDQFIERLKDRSNVVIFAGWNRFRSSGKIKRGQRDEILNTDQYYHWNWDDDIDMSIPIINLMGKHDKYLYILDVNSIEVNIYRNDSAKWYEKELLVDVTEYHQDDITDYKVKEWYLIDGSNCEPIDITSEIDGTHIKIICKNDFEFGNPDNFLVIDLSLLKNKKSL